MTSRFRVTFNEIVVGGLEEPFIYILRVKNVNSLFDHYKALERVHKWADYQMRCFRNVVSYSVEVLDV